MKHIRSLILASALFASLAPAFAQAPPPVPALPDTERRTSYVISASTCICNVNFALYGDSTDFGNWVDVWLNGVLMDVNSPTNGWTITSPTGSLGTIPRPINNAILTFNTPQTGTVQIVGQRRPRRTQQFAENRGVAARDLNQVLTDIIATQREFFDKTNDFTGRGIFGVPGEVFAPLPAASLRSGKYLGFDPSGSPIVATSVPGTGIGGPVSSTVGNLPLFSNTGGTAVSDSGISGAFKQPASYPVNVTSGHVACAADSDCQFGNAWSQYPLGMVSTNPIMIGKAGSSIGSNSVGQIFRIVLMSAGLTGSPITASYTAIGGDTVSTVATNLCAVVNANPNLHSAAGGKPIFCQPTGAGGFNLQYDAAYGVGGATPMTTATTGSTGTITLAGEQTALDFVVLQLGRNTAPRPAQVGDGLVGLDITGPDSTGVFNTHYAQITGAVAVPTAGATRGLLNFNTTNNVGFPVGRVGIKEGVYLYNSTGVAPTGGDVGPGTFNLPSTGGYYINGNAFALNGAMYAPGGNLFGGAVPASSLNLQSTQSGAPVGDFVQVTAGGKVGYKFDGVDSTFGTSGTLLGSTSFVNLTSGSIKIQPPTGALGSRVLTLPVATDTLVGKATTDILTNKTFDTAGAGNALSINGVNAATAWSTFTPAAACGTATFTVNSARSKTLGKLTYIQIELTFTALGTCGITNITFNLPNTAQSGGALIGREIATNKGVNCIILASGTTAGCLRTEATTWIAGDHFVASGVYENQ